MNAAEQSIGKSIDQYRLADTDRYFCIPSLLSAYQAAGPNFSLYFIFVKIFKNKIKMGKNIMGILENINLFNKKPTRSERNAF